MNQKIIDYLQQNKTAYPKEALIQQLRTSGYVEGDIQEAVDILYNVDNALRNVPIPVPKMNNIATATQNETYAVGVSTFLYVLLAILFLLFLFPLITTPNLFASLIVGGCVALILYYFQIIKVYINNTNLIVRKKIILFSDIKKITMNFEMGAMTATGKKIPIDGICFWGISNNQEPLAIIFSKIYDRKGLVYLMNILVKNIPNLEMDEYCQAMSRDDFGSIEKIGLKKMLPSIIWTMIFISIIAPIGKILLEKFF